LTGEHPLPGACACGVVAGLLRLGLALAVVLAVLAGAAELALRAAGVKPQPAREATNVVPDGWTGFRLRPGVSGQESFVTNDLGMHAPRSYAPAPAPGVLRVALLGSSVVYGINLPFSDTLASATERELRAAGRVAEVLNFGTHAYSIVNVSALLQSYVHQLDPAVVVVVVDLQVGRARWPPVRPGVPSPDDGAAALEGLPALVARGARHSVVLSLVDDPRPARRWLRRTTGLQLHPHPGLEPLGRGARAAADAAASPSEPLAGPAAATAEGVEEYERRRERELRAPLAAMAAFAAEASIELYFVTPYGPYFDVTGEELGRMSVGHFIEDATRAHGDARRALGAEVELVTRVVRRVGDASSAGVIDMLEASRATSRRRSGHFAADGVHLTREGNEALGRIIAARIVADLEPGSRPGS
jgi:hypothetical protein